MEINIPEDKESYLSEQAKEEFSGSLQSYATDLFDEASRLETASRVSEGEPEITRTMIKDAALYLKKYTHNSKPKSWWFTLLQLVSTLSTLFTGGLFNIDKFKNDSTYLIIFLLVLTVTIVSNTAVIILGRSK